MQAKLTPGGQALCTPDTSASGSAEETSIRQLLANGKSKTALDRAKDFHKKLGSAAAEALLLDAYAGRIQALLDQNLTLEARTLLELVRGRYPSGKARLDALSAISAARAGALDELLAPLADAALSAERRSAIDQTIQNNVADLAAIAACATLPADHTLRTAAAALDRAFAATTSGPVTDEEILLPEVSHRSPLGSWKSLVRAIAYFYRGQDDACRESLGAIRPESIPARLIPALNSMLGAKPAAPLTPAASALVSRTTESFAALRSELEKLDRAFTDSDDEGQIFKLIRSAMQECRRTAPEQVEALKRLIYVRGSMGDTDIERMAAALQGMPRKDASFLRAIAHGMESTGDPEDLAIACGYWDEFRQHAVREGWFGAKGVEAATLYLHMAGLLRRVPEEMLTRFQRKTRADRTLEPEESYFLYPERLYERSCFLDPNPENFSQWLQWAAQESSQQGEDVAKAWHKIRPSDIEPLLYLLQQAEKRNAYPSALTYLDKAERIDAVHSAVRAARMRLLAGSALSHLQKKKPHLAAEKLKIMAELPQSRQGDRPAFLAALAWVIGIDRNDDGAVTAARAESERLLGSEIAARMLALGIAAAAKCPPIDIPRVAELNPSELSDLPVSIARVVAIAKDLGIRKFKLPFEYLNEAANRFPRIGSSLDTGQLQLLAETALAMDNSEFAYAVSAEGLNRGGPAEARFLLLRAQSLPGFEFKRRGVCAAAAAEIARTHRDMELVGSAIDLVREVFGPEPFLLKLDQAREVVRKEIAASDFPGFREPGPDYSALLPDELCNCPDCRRARGEMVGPFGDDDFNKPIDDARMEEIFKKQVPQGMPPDIARMLFGIMKEAYLKGVDPNEILDQLDDSGDLGSGSRGKGRQGKRR